MTSAAERISPIPEIEKKRKQESYEELVHRLSVQSVRKHYDAYADIDWDAPEMAVRKDDPRWEYGAHKTLRETAWYKSQPPEVRAELGLAIVAAGFKIAVVFESLLSLGLLEYAAKLPNGSAEFRYIFHEMIEEGQHTLMFQEFINRSGMNPPGLAPWAQHLGRFAAMLTSAWPELFFFFILGGEEPQDYITKQRLRGAEYAHPLTERMIQIHVLEEARHLCFARNHLLERVPKLGWLEKRALSYAIPFILGPMVRMTQQPPSSVIRRYNIPDSVVREAYTESPAHKQRALNSMVEVASLCIELGLLHKGNAWLWKKLGMGGAFEGKL